MKRVRVRRQRSTRARIVAVFVVALGIHALAATTTAAPVANVPKTTLVVLGDSLTWGTNYFANSQSRLAAAGQFESVLVDSRWGRRISGPTSTRYSGTVAYKQLITTGVRPTAVLVALGSNDVAILTKRKEYVTVIQDLMNAVGNIPVVWLTVHRVDSATTTRQSQRFNAVLTQELAKYPLASVYDWVNVVKTTPSVLDPDKIHLTSLGSEVRTRVYLELAVSLAQRASDATSTTTSTTTVPPTTTLVPSTTVAP
jgi:lysophospholipase L1-like esterase